MRGMTLAVAISLSLCISALGQRKQNDPTGPSLALSAPFRAGANQAQRDIQELMDRGVDAITNEIIDESAQWNALKSASDVSLAKVGRLASTPDEQYIIQLLKQEQTLISNLHVAFNKAGKSDNKVLFDEASTKAVECNAHVEDVLNGKNPAFGSCKGIAPPRQIAISVKKADSPPRMGLASTSTGSENNLAFHGIRVGQLTATLPFKCTDDIFCSGNVDGNHILINVSGSTVLIFDVIYAGSSLGQTIVAPPITLGEAVKAHSLQNGAAPPQLRYANNDRGETYGIVDLANRIVYNTTTAPALAPRWISQNQVAKVTYLSPSAPVLSESEQNLLKAGEAQLLADARTSQVYSSQPSTNGANSSVIGQSAGPFGFEYGMTQQQLIKLVGKQAVKKTTDHSIEVTTAPRPHPAFESYVLFISPDKGLLKVVAIGRDISTNGFGEEVSSQFSEMQTAISKLYGSPTHSYDEVHTGSLWNEPQDWMMGLLKNERTLVSFWNLKSAPVNHILMIDLEAHALSTENGYNSVGYEFEGWEEFVETRKAKADSNF